MGGAGQRAGGERGRIAEPRRQKHIADQRIVETSRTIAEEQRALLDADVDHGDLDLAQRARQIVLVGQRRAHLQQRLSARMQAFGLARLGEHIEERVKAAAQQHGGEQPATRTQHPAKLREARDILMVVAQDQVGDGDVKRPGGKRQALGIGEGARGPALCVRQVQGEAPVAVDGNEPTKARDAIHQRLRQRARACAHLEKLRLRLQGRQRVEQQLRRGPQQTRGHVARVSLAIEAEEHRAGVSTSGAERSAEDFEYAAPVPIDVTGTAIVTRKGLRRARRSWPWLGAEDIVRYDGDGGPFVDLLDETSLPMGTALYDPHGKAPIRLLSSARTRDPVGLIHARLERAMARRELDLDGSDAGRLCHGEADGVPGLFVDRFGPGLLIDVDAPPMVPVVEELLELLVERTGATTVVVRKHGAAGAAVVLALGSDPRVHFVHGRLELGIDLSSPHASEITVDLERQREVRRWARGRCLDLGAGFCGFGLQLAEAGATEVVFVDDAAALSTTVADDAKRNDISVRLERVEASPLDWLRADSAPPPRFDVVVFHPRGGGAVVSDSEETAAARAQEHASLCLKLLDEGGILACVSPPTLSDNVASAAMQDAAARSRKRLQILARLGPGPDHPMLAGVPAPSTLLVARVLATA